MPSRLLFLTFPVAIWLIEGASAGRLGGVISAGRSAGCGFGFGFFVAGLDWIGLAFLVDAKTFAWLLPFAVIGASGRIGILHRWLRADVYAVSEDCAPRARMTCGPSRIVRGLSRVVAQLASDGRPRAS